MHVAIGPRYPLLRLIEGYFPVHRSQWGSIYFGLGVPQAAPCQVMTLLTAPYQPAVYRNSTPSDYGKVLRTIKDDPIAGMASSLPEPCGGLFIVKDAAC